MTSVFRSENEWTARLARWLSKPPGVVVGIGDDAAVVAGAGVEVELVYTTDAVVEGVHFLPGVEPRRIGHKMAGRLLSDLAAMGAEPQYLFFNLVMPPGYSIEAMEHMYQGADALAAPFGAGIIGGDTICASPLGLHGFATGRVPRGQAVRRSGAAAGDRLYVTGRLGDSLSGKHLHIEPRVREGIWLREGGWATAMMDISDGLARDLPRLCESSGVGVELHVDAVPANTSFVHALNDGEDYELLFTVSADRCAAFEKAWASAFQLSCSCVGVMTERPESRWLVHPDGRRERLVESGFDHLSR